MYLVYNAHQSNRKLNQSVDLRSHSKTNNTLAIGEQSDYGDYMTSPSKNAKSRASITVKSKHAPSKNDRLIHSVYIRPGKTKRHR